MVDFKHAGFPAFASETGCLDGTAKTQALYTNIELHPTEKMGAGAFE